MTTQPTPTEFFMIYIDGRSAPAKKFLTYEGAQAECARLVSKEHQTGYILKPVASCQPIDQVKWETL